MIMWIMNFLPNWMFHLLFIAGVVALAASFVVKFIPLLTQYKTPVQIVAVLTILVATWFEGAISNQNAWIARVKEMEAKVAKAEEQSQQTNTDIKEKVVKQVEYIKTRGDDIVKYVDREVVKYDSKCEIPAEFVKAHNQAAEKLK
jgi:4-hydroxyphenylpyruvate dioxygenase-like putative hemolysin